VPSPQRQLTHEDLWELPDDGNRYELIDGELFVTPAPRVRHQAAVGHLYAVLREQVHALGGRVYVSPVAVRFAPDSVLEPDVVVMSRQRLDQRQERWIDAPPDLVIEVSSPSTASHDLIRKRRVYEQHGVPEYWYVDLDAEQVFVHVLQGEGYGDPAAHGPDALVTSYVLEDVSVEVAPILDAD